VVIPTVLLGKACYFLLIFFYLLVPIPLILFTLPALASLGGLLSFCHDYDMMISGLCMAARNMAYEFRHSGSWLRVRALLRVCSFVLYSIQDLFSVFALDITAFGVGVINSAYTHHSTHTIFTYDVCSILVDRSSLIVDVSQQSRTRIGTHRVT
jgi:hypothetical protein